MMQRDSLPFRALLQMAGPKSAAESGRCRLVLELLGTASAVRAALKRSFADLHLADLDFEVLVSMYALQPDAATPAMLAVYTGTTRPAITDAVDRLEARALVRRERDMQDRRSLSVYLTPAGVTAAETCVTRFVKYAGRLAEAVPLGTEPALSDVWHKLCNAAAAMPPASNERISIST